ncbi:hypothetical protein HPB51_024266 [Rhipicephalus microplus]|uniref:Uncharacterized protein n=1 Tax=Rhipicephalus microplus TaxID=6941 RepID=A0A9J6EJ04_RHIMP|nr:hypothetical protein HPB51_024266 [Rhipicephalus microplus]
MRRVRCRARLCQRHSSQLKFSALRNQLTLTVACTFFATDSEPALSVQPVIRSRCPMVLFHVVARPLGSLRVRSGAPGEGVLARGLPGEERARVLRARACCGPGPRDEWPARSRRAKSGAALLARSPAATMTARLRPRGEIFFGRAVCRDLSVEREDCAKSLPASGTASERDSYFEFRGCAFLVRDGCEPREAAVAGPAAARASLLPPELIYGNADRFGRSQTRNACAAASDAASVPRSLLRKV